MRDVFVSIVTVVSGAVLLATGAYAARSCDTSTASSGFQYRLGDVRYDGPDPAKANDLATIAASLQSSSGTPLYECVSQWPEAWKGWYGGATGLIWSDCIFTGAGTGADETVSFAIDWKVKTMYLTHTFACSGKQGSEGLATGSISLDFNCTTADDSSFCVPKSTSSGARPTLNINTKLSAVALNATTLCADRSKKYQSWKIEKWNRQIEMTPGSSPTNPLVVADTGPSFSLRSLVTGSVATCTNTGSKNGIFEGTCQSQPDDATTTTKFSFDTKLNMLDVSQSWKCDGSSTVDAVGVGYIQAACERVFNSNKFTCASDPVWIGTGVV
ncbi:hypothetical protein C8A05DRAFT_45685 [Staphylotrichum tortipilum]|uniref:Uncharacterized protein n=1 Tax=Staphylotrichum tortipilum TaxID=2831512 RepID=A0AAN6MI07_9PEZI|nr:hypothetical protein C8A05DRAFT_45685 [Staphylotrichum longicolle]